MSKLRYSEIKSRIDLDSVKAAIGFCQTGSHGPNDIGYCLFPQNHQHGDTTGKFAIHREKLVYNCFVCGGGSLISLIMELYDFDVDEATYWLAQYAGEGDNRSDQEFHDYLLSLIEDVEERVDTMPYFNERVLDRFNGPIDYFLTRGISESVAIEYRLCSSDHAVKSAPIKGGEKIDEDYWGPVAVFPHYWQGRLVGWQHRWLDWDDEHTKTPKWLAKYTNTTDFPKHNTLFNYEQSVMAEHPIVILESVPSVLFLASYDIPAVSYFGGDQLKPEQLRLLRRFNQGVILAPDNDKTGDRFVRSATKYLERFIPVWHADKVELGTKADLGDYAKTDDPKGNLMKHLTKHIHLAGVEI